MLTVLFNTTDTLDLVTDSAATLKVLVTYTDRVKASGAWLSTNRTGTSISSATTTTILAAPASTEVRAANTVFIVNTHASLSVNVTPRYNANATIYEQPVFLLAPGAALEFIEYLGWFTISAAASGFGDVLERRLDAAGTGQNIATVQPWFPTTGSVAVEAATVYGIEGLLSLTRSAGATSHTTSLGFGGTATLTSILWHAQCNTGDTLANIALNSTSAKAATSTVVKAASTSATEEIMIHINGSVKINAAGTFIPQFTYSAIPGGTPTVNLGSFFQLIKKGTGFSAKGTWT
jgi:hypothetical protein